jgi:hypothetical protein
MMSHGIEYVGYKREYYTQLVLFALWVKGKLIRHIASNLDNAM